MLGYPKTLKGTGILSVYVLGLYIECRIRTLKVSKTLSCRRFRSMAMVIPVESASAPKREPKNERELENA
jgi:hypothetical protein